VSGAGQERDGAGRPRRGRVLDCRPAPCGVLELHLLVGSEICSLVVPCPQGWSPEPGDLVALSGDAGGRVTGLTRLGGAEPGAWDALGDGLRWRHPGQEVSRALLLRRRHEVVRVLRNWFEEQSFLEIQAPLLVRGTCPDVFLDSFPVGDRYLTTSTEYQLKRLVAGGFARVFTLTQNFRPGDVGATHNPEFTMLEWARAWADLAAIEQDAEAFVWAAFQRLHPGESHLLPAPPPSPPPAGAASGTQVTTPPAPPLYLRPPWPRQSVRQALGEQLGVELDAAFSLPALVAGARQLGLDLPQSFARDRVAVLSLLLEALQPRLGLTAPLWLCDWPAFLTSSAPALPGDRTVVARSELFVRGLELADGFPFQTCPARQRHGFAAQQRQRRAAGKPPVALDERYLEALRQGLPPGAGMALGVDRLVMVLTGQREIRNVLAFAWDEV